MTGDRAGKPELLEDNVTLEPGMLVRNPARSEWGIGQIQSIDGARITVNFQNSGKLVLDGSVVALDPTSSRTAGQP